MTGGEIALIKSDSAGNSPQQTGAIRPRQSQVNREAVFRKCLDENVVNKVPSKRINSGSTDAEGLDASEDYEMTEWQQLVAMVFSSDDTRECLKEIKKLLDSKALNSVDKIKAALIDKLQHLILSGKLTVVNNQANIEASQTAIRVTDIVDMLMGEARAQHNKPLENALHSLREQAFLSGVLMDTPTGKPVNQNNRRSDFEERLGTKVQVKSAGSKEASESAAGRADNNVRSLMDYESNRLANRKLSSHGETGQTVGNSKSAGDELNRDMMAFNRTDSTIPRFITRETGLNSTRPVVTNPQDVIDQIVKKAEMIVKTNSSEMKIDIKPEFLGKMTIKIAVEEGVLTARFITENHQVKHLLEGNLHTLKQSLESQGIKVEKAEVNVQLSNDGMFDGSEDTRQSLWDWKGQEHFNRSFVFSENETEAVLSIPEEEDPSDQWQTYSLENGGMSFLV